jgi:putative phosphoribosyl transferase
MVDTSRFRDRSDAGRRLAALLVEQGCAPDPLVLALPRGGVPVGAEIARQLDAPLDVLVVRKIGHPLQPELAIGAVGSGGIEVLNPEFAGAFEPEKLERLAAGERAEIERRELIYRGERPAPHLRDRNVILVDDGLATGATMLAAVRAARAAGARHVSVAVPVGDAGVCARLAKEADRVACLMQPRAMMAVGNWYYEFRQLSDSDVRAALHAVDSNISTRSTNRWR